MADHGLKSDFEGQWNHRTFSACVWPLPAYPLFIVHATQTQTGTTSMATSSNVTMKGLGLRFTTTLVSRKVKGLGARKQIL